MQHVLSRLQNIQSHTSTNSNCSGDESELCTLALPEFTAIARSLLCSVLQSVQNMSPRAGWKNKLAAAAGIYATTSNVANTTTGTVQPIQGKVGDMVWSACPSNSALPGAECGYAIVPLDYTNPDAGVAKIALGRYNATASTRKGSIFVNPGGPGGPGVSLATRSGNAFQQFLGEEWDIIGFDPRGIGASEPATKCFPAEGARTAFIANTVLDRGYDVGPDLNDTANRFHLIQQQRDADALYASQFAICSQTMGDTLRYMGTTTVARDIDFITTLVDGKDALINFYGLSYGTVIGQYLANIFPDRVGRIAIDGVVDAIAWATQPAYTWYRTWMISTDPTYENFLDDCAKAGPSLCALATSPNDTASAIMDRVESFVNKLYDSPMPVPNATIPGILTFGRARIFMLHTLAVPESWPSAATTIAAAMAGDASAMLDAVNEKDLVDLERSAVSCNDVKPFAPPKPEDVIDEALFVLGNVSRFVLAETITEPDSGCQFWPVSPPERYLGPFNNTLKNPMLIISNTNDPATPLLNGRIVHETLGNSSSTILVQDGPGHTSLALTSVCTIRSLRAFFANGTLPAAGTVCPVDAETFPKPQASGGIGSVAIESQALATGTDYASSRAKIASHIPRLRHMS